MVFHKILHVALDTCLLEPETYYQSQIEECFNPIRPGPFSRSPGQGGSARGPDAKNHNHHQSIEMKYCMSHYSHKSMPDAKFHTFPRFGNMSQNFPLKKGTGH